MTGHVLLVDDEKEFATYTAKRLTIRGWQVTVVHDGPAAVQAVETSESEFDVVILDMLMPGMNGTEILIQIHRLRAELPVILLSGHGAGETAQEGLEAGAAEFLLKPCDFDKLIAAIERALS